MEEKEIRSIIESLLFVWGDPLELKEISKVLDIAKKQTKEILNRMIDDFNFQRRGIRIIRINNSYQLSTRPEHNKWISELSKSDTTKSLSTAALETLSIIAYKQPITKNEIEGIRGVRCDRAVKTLFEKDLIEEKGRLERTGRPIIYGTTMEFLRYFGIKSLKNLPVLKNFKIEYDEKVDLEK